MFPHVGQGDKSDILSDNNKKYIFNVHILKGWPSPEDIVSVKT